VRAVRGAIPVTGRAVKLGIRVAVAFAFALAVALAFALAVALAFGFAPTLSFAVAIFLLLAFRWFAKEFSGINLKGNKKDKYVEFCTIQIVRSATKGIMGNRSWGKLGRELTTAAPRMRASNATHNTRVFIM